MIDNTEQEIAMANILVVEDDIHINELIKMNLTLVGHTVIQCFSGAEIDEVMEQHNIINNKNNLPIDLIILDVMLPGRSGFEIIKDIKNIPVIFLTAKGELEYKLKGLTLGAQDYIVKPFEMLELIARIDVVLGRSHKGERTFKLKDVTVDLDKRTVKKAGEEVTLAHREFCLLETLIHNKNIALSREKLLELAWGYDYEGETKTVDVHIQKLRKKLGWENEIKTVIKVGYRLEV